MASFFTHVKNFFLGKADEFGPLQKPVQKPIQKVNYLINDSDIKLHAPHVFSSVMDFYSDIKKFEEMNLDKTMTDKIREEIYNEMGLKPDDIYSEKLLDNSVFKVLVIFDLGVSRMLGKSISHPEFLMFRKMYERIIMDGKNIPKLSVDSLLIKQFKVDPSILPKDFLKMLMAVDEYAMGCEMILNSMPDMKHFDTFKSLEEYSDHAKEFVTSLTEKLHEKGLYNTHDIERFAGLCMCAKCGLPYIDSPYKNPAEGDYRKVPTDVIYSLLKKYFQAIGMDTNQFGDDEGSI